MGSEAFYVIKLDAYGELVGLSIDGEDMVECDGRPEGKGEGEVIYSIGADPAKGEGIEIVDFSGQRCVHYYCRWWCPRSTCS